ncbi:MAG: T9SS type A sorting domain-containing protein [Bacteroidales bacterium]|nr:T9SS type A sorting domain-containing protein [Bacteroidales bacterium]
MKNSNLSRFTLLFVFIFAGCMFGLRAQSAITFCGGDAQNNSAILSFSAGQIATQTSVARAITVVNITQSYTEGVQQPFTPRDNERYENIDPLHVNMSIFPNPTYDHVIIESNQEMELLKYTLYNTNGQVIYQGSYQGGQEQIDLQSYPAGSYMLQVYNADKTQMNVYKIIKAK